MNLRDSFPVLSSVAYLNAGTNGPLPLQAAEAAKQELEREVAAGRTQEGFERRHALAEALRARYAAVLGCRPDQVALTSCTSEGLSLFLLGLDLKPGDEVLTSDEEHPGLLGALQAVRDLRGVTVREEPFPELDRRIGPRTRVIACSHVSWVSGQVAPPGLGERPERVWLLLDGAQGVGAVPTDVEDLRCDGYAGAGQKWLCGPDGLGMLYLSDRAFAELKAVRRGYTNLAQPNAGLDAPLQPDCRRFDGYALGAPLLAAGLAALELLLGAGLPALQRLAIERAGALAQALTSAGYRVAERGPTTLVSFAVEDPTGTVRRLREEGVVVREIPGRGLVRASVGPWNDERDLERLVGALRSGPSPPGGAAAIKRGDAG
jgi:selenocysteine lyase/cysteine desulfurase